MNSVLTTEAGTAVYEPSSEEFSTYVENRVRTLMSMSVEDFTRAYAAGELDDASPEVSELAALLRIGQNSRDDSR